jgi:hypothetical protein
VYDADDEADEPEEVVAPELPDDALRITAMPFVVVPDTERVVVLAVAGGVMGLPPSAALADVGTSRTDKEQQNPSADAMTARLIRIDMVVHLPQSTADSARMLRAQLVDSGANGMARAGGMHDAAPFRAAIRPPQAVVCQRMTAVIRY